MEFQQSLMEYDDPDHHNNVIDVTVGLVYCQGTRVQNVDRRGNGVRLSAGAGLVMNNSVFNVGPLGYCVQGDPGSDYFYGQVTYSNSQNVQNTITTTAIAQAFVLVP